MFGFDWQTILIRFPLVFLAISVHETAHGYVAWRLGDPTAKLEGRLTLNPVKHLDIMGALCMLLFRFGWAKAVPVNSRYFKNPKTGMSLVGAAGPLSNILLALIFAVTYGLLLRFSVTAAGMGHYLERILIEAVILNVNLAVFNLIPLPPLDGSKIVGALLPNKAYYTLLQYEVYMMPILFILLIKGYLNPVIGFLTKPILSSLDNVINLIYKL